MRFIIISGFSGGGKSVALHALEDLNYFAVDNLRLNLLPALADELSDTDRVAAVVDVRDRRHIMEAFPSLLEAVRDRGIDPEVLFLEADRDVPAAHGSKELDWEDIAPVDSIALEYAARRPVGRHFRRGGRHGEADDW